MPGNSKLLDVLPDGYGYVLLVGIGHTVVNIWLALKVEKARKEYKIEVMTAKFMLHMLFLADNAFVSINIRMGQNKPLIMLIDYQNIVVC